MAQFVSERRENIGLSQSGLAKRSHLEMEQIDSIESGKELFLSSTVRQKLAKGLKLTLEEIKKYEKSESFNFDVDFELLEEYRHKILEDSTQDLYCPICHSKLNVRIAKMYDLEDNLVLEPKAVCTKCPFQIKSND